MLLNNTELFIFAIKKQQSKSRTVSLRGSTAPLRNKHFYGTNQPTKSPTGTTLFMCRLAHRVKSLAYSYRTTRNKQHDMLATTQTPSGSIYATEGNKNLAAHATSKNLRKERHSQHSGEGAGKYVP